VVSVAIATLAVAYVVARHVDWPLFRSDLDHQLCAARVLAQGGDPYAATGEGRACPWGFPLYYPATALVALMPIAWLPPVIARAVFVFVGAFALAYACTRDGWHRLPLFASGAFYVAVARAQWSLLLTAAVVLPPLGALLGGKPTLGIAILAGSPRRTWVAALVGGGVIGALSLWLRPTWPWEWGAVVRHAPAALTAVACGPLGWCALATVLRWREPAARVTFLAALVPLTQSPYEAVPLFLAPRTATQSAVLALATHVGGLLHTNAGPFTDIVGSVQFYGRWCAPLALACATYAVLAKPRPQRPLVVASLTMLNLAILATSVWLALLFSGASRPGSYRDAEPVAAEEVEVDDREPGAAGAAIGANGDFVDVEAVRRQRRDHEPAPSVMRVHVLPVIRGVALQPDTESPPVTDGGVGEIERVRVADAFVTPDLMRPRPERELDHHVVVVRGVLQQQADRWCDGLPYRIAAYRKRDGRSGIARIALRALPSLTDGAMPDVDVRRPARVHVIGGRSGEDRRAPLRRVEGGVLELVVLTGRRSGAQDVHLRPRRRPAAGCRERSARERKPGAVPMSAAIAAAT
jgi:hypothetical protein